MDTEKKYVVRYYYRTEGWRDDSGPLSMEDAQKHWNKMTSNGTRLTEYPEYYDIFPADTKMLFSSDWVDDE